MRVVVTRPENSAGRTAERLRVLGHEPVLLPLTRPVHAPEIALQALDGRYSAFAVTSAEAVRVLASLGDRLPPHLDKTVYAVGNATAEAANEAGFKSVLAGSGTGAELAEFIAAHRTSTVEPLLYLAGKPRSGTFENGLHDRGIPFLTAEIYEMKAITYDRAPFARVLSNPPADAVLLYSPENARLFFASAKSMRDLPPDLKILCLSDNVAKAVPGEYHRNIKIAGQLDEDGLFALL